MLLFFLYTGEKQLCTFYWLFNSLSPLITFIPPSGFSHDHDGNKCIYIFFWQLFEEKKKGLNCETFEWKASLGHSNCLSHIRSHLKSTV